MRKATFVHFGIVIAYFAVLILLVFLSCKPAYVTIGLLLFIVPGLLLISSNTLLFYSVALLPAFLLHRFHRKMRVSVLVGAASVAMMAILPSVLSYAAMTRPAASDFLLQSSFQPHSFELPYQQWGRPIRRTSNSHPRGQPLCGDLCQQLLFTEKANAVYSHLRPADNPSETIIISATNAFRIKPGGQIEPLVPNRNKPVLAPKPDEIWRFRLETRDFCPDTLSYIEADFVRQVVSGHCLIEERADTAVADVVVETRLSKNTRKRRIDPCDQVVDPFRLLSFYRFEEEPFSIRIIENRDDESKPVEQKTALKGLHSHCRSMSAYGHVEARRYPI